MTQFSMFERALEAARLSEVEDLGRVSLVSRRDFDERPTFTFRAPVPCLEYLSLLIETALLLRTKRTGRIYVNFEKLSRMEPVADRYLRIADVSERVYVFGEPDWKPPRHPNMRVVAPTSRTTLAREWFVLVDSSTLRAALIGVPEEGDTATTPETRIFRAIKTTDPAIVAQLVAAIEEWLDYSLTG